MSRHDISHQLVIRGLARTAGQDIVGVACASPELVSGADILVLRDVTGALVPARYLGQGNRAFEHVSLMELAGAYRVDRHGVTLASILGGMTAPDASRAERGHDWGALGLPDGAETRVAPADEVSGLNELELALRSVGYERFAGDRRLSIAPGDTVTVNGQSALVVAVDRRNQRLDVDVGGDDVIGVTFDEINELERSR